MGCRRTWVDAVASLDVHKTTIQCSTQQTVYWTTLLPVYLSVKLH